MKGKFNVLIIVGLSMLLFIAVTTAMGARLLWLAWKTRERAELYAGLAFMLIGTLGHPLIVASGFGTTNVGDVWFAAYVVGLCCTEAAMGFFVAFTATVFRQRATWALALLWVIATALAIGTVGSIRLFSLADPALPCEGIAQPFELILQVTGTLAFVWTTGEGYLQWHKSRKRMALGLADPVIVNRFLLWTIFGGCTVTLTLLYALAPLFGVSPLSSPVVHLCTAVLSTTSTGAIFLGFFPPRRYTSWITARAQA